MQIHVVLAHPEPKSLNGQLARLSADKLSTPDKPATISDLYAMDFDPREGAAHYKARANPDRFDAQTEQRASAEADALPQMIEQEIERLLAADVLIVHFPLWWFGPPAILKGWMDRVFVYGRVYRSAMRYDTGIARGRRMMACVTTGASAESCAPNGREGDTLMHLWPVLFPFRYIGFEVLQPHVFHGVGGVAEREGHAHAVRRPELDDWALALSQIDRRELVRYNSSADFDDNLQLREGAPSYSPFIRHAR